MRPEEYKNAKDVDFRVPDTRCQLVKEGRDGVEAMELLSPLSLAGLGFHKGGGGVRCLQS